MVGKNIADMDLTVVGRRGKRLTDDIWNPSFQRVADHPGDSWQGRQFIGSALSVATGHQYPGSRVFTMHAPNGLPHVVIGRGSDCASVQNHQIGVSGFLRGRQPLLVE